MVATSLSFTTCTPASDPQTDFAPDGQRATWPLNRSISLYQQPEGDLTKTLAPGDFFHFTGRYSSDLYWRKTGSDTLLEPYLELMLADSSRHWAYADPAHFQLSVASEEWQWSNRLQTLLSPDQWRDYQQLQQQWQESRPQTPLLLLFQATRRLRDDLEEALHLYPSLPLTDYEKVLPACLSYYRDGRPAWWLDYNQWQQRATQHGAAAEKALFSFYTQRVYPPDGIEYDYPAWQFPVSTEQAHSLLGRGQHQQLLRALDSLQQKHPFANAEWDQARNYLLQDITAPETTFWEPWSVVDSTLAEILRGPWVGLNSADLERITRQRERLRQQGEHGQQFDFRNR